MKSSKLKKAYTEPVTPITPAYVRKLLSANSRVREWPDSLVQGKMALLKLKREIRRQKH